MAVDIGLVREEVVFVVPETNWGQLAYPEPGHLVIPVGATTINQNLSYTDSEELRDTRSLIARFRDRVPPGNFTVSAYIRPSGAAGTPPMGDVLFEGLLGKKETGTSVTYSPAKKLPSFSLWVKKSHTVFFADGCVVNEGRLSLSHQGACTVEFSGNFRRMGWAGTDALASSVTAGATTIEVTDGSKFTADAKIVIGGDDNGGQGYKITAVSGNTLTIDPGLSADASAGAEVKGWLPDASSVSFGDPIENRTFVVKVDGSEKLLRSFELTVNNNNRFIDDEIASSLYPTGFVEGNRAVNGRATLYFRKDEVELFRKGYDGARVELEVIGGDGPGYTIRVVLPRAYLEVPSITSENPTVGLDLSYTALGDAGEDEVQIIFE